MDDCNFCNINFKGINRKNRRPLVNSNLVFAIRPIPHSGMLPVPVLNVFLRLTLPSSKEDSSPQDDTRDQDFSFKTLPKLFSLVRDLNLPKYSAELLASQLKEKDPLKNVVHINFYWSRREEFLSSEKRKS